MSNKNTQEIRWGILGCGDVTEVKSGPAYSQTAGFKIQAVMRRNLEKVKDYAKRHGIEKYYTNADELINDPEVDAVYIATPPDSHMLYALKVAAAGKPCCVEKPLANSYEDSQRITTAFSEKNLPLFVAYYRRTLPRFEQVNKWLKDGEIGETRHIDWHFSKPPNDIDLSEAPNWRTDPTMAPGGYFDDLASHGLDLFIHYLGNIKEVSGIQVNQQGLYKVSDAFTANWLHENGVTGTANLNFGCAYREDNVKIFGSKGTIEFSVFKENPLVLKYGEEREVLEIEHPKHIQKYHVENMKKELFQEGYVHPSNGATATHTTWVMDKILGNI